MLDVDRLGESGPQIGVLGARYRTYQLVSTSSVCRFVSRPFCFAPVAWLLGSVRNSSRFTGRAPLERRYAFRKAAWLSSSSVLSEMYCGMSLSRFDSAAMYAGLPPFTPPSSLYCCHRSVSINSIAASSRKIATSPAVIGRLAARASLANTAAPGTAATPASPTPFRNDRRPTTPRHRASRSPSPDDSIGWADVASDLLMLCLSFVGLSGSTGMDRGGKGQGQGRGPA